MRSHYSADTGLLLVFRKFHKAGSLRDHVFGSKPKQDFLSK